MDRMIVFALALLLQAAPAENLDRGLILYENCKNGLRSLANNDSSDSFELGECFGYIDGLTDGIKGPDYGICFQNPTFATLAKVYIAYMDRNPKYLDGSRNLSVVFALQDAYPCPATPAKK